MALDGVRLAVLTFVAAVLQVSVFSDVRILGGTPDVLLVTIAVTALYRGAIPGAVAGFGAGIVVDVALLGTLGFTSLLLTLVGYWVGRYGETTGRASGPYLPVVIVSALYTAGALGLHFIVGDPAPAREVLLDTFFQGIGLNLIVTVPVAWLARRVVPRRPLELQREAGALG